MTDTPSLRRVGLAAVTLAMAVGLAGCTRGNFSAEPPVHLNPNMDKQEKFRSQSENTFYEDRSAMRMPVPGTVAQGWLQQDDKTPVAIWMNSRGALMTEQTSTPEQVESEAGSANYVTTLSGPQIAQFYTGKDAQEEAAPFVAHSPLPATAQLLARGEERFTIYCVPCHGHVGDGDGIIVRRGMLRPPSYTDDRLLAMADGEIFNTITNGKNNMPSYRHQISTPDRWAIVSYVRALQRSQHATLQDVPGGASVLPKR